MREQMAHTACQLPLSLQPSALCELLRPHFRSLSQLTSLRVFAAANPKLGAIKELRERSGAPIADVKSALEEAKYNQDEAYQNLRKRGLAAATKKASRHAAEGLIGLARDGVCGALVEVNSETDFVARNESFRSLVSAAAQAALRADSGSQAGPSGLQLSAEDLTGHTASGGQQLGDCLQEVTGALREHIRIRRAARLEAPGGVLASYLHASPAPGLGRIGTMVALEANGPPIPAEKVAQAQVAIDAESAILREQAAKTRKPAHIVEKMMQGRLGKFYEEVCFLEQSFIMDDSAKVADIVSRLSKDVGTELRLAGFVRMQCGEGLGDAAGKKDFASEVNDTLAQVA